jgi:hypothetical protein
MQYILLFFISVSMMLPVSAHSAGYPEPITIISYYQFQQLKTADQVKYLNDLRELLVMVDFYNAEMADSGKEKSEAITGFMRLFLPHADAAAGATYKCPAGTELRQWTRDGGKPWYVCMMITQEKDCPPGMTSVLGQQSGSSWMVCHHEASETKGPATKGSVREIPLSKAPEKDSGPMSTPKDAELPLSEAAPPMSKADPAMLDKDGKLIVPKKNVKPEKDEVCKPFKCDMTPEGRMAAKENFETRRNDANNRCIMGGFPSKYNYNRRKCQPLTTIKIGTKKYSCKAGETMCNPLFFGVTAENEALCIPVQLEATKTCFDQSKTADVLKYLKTPPDPLTNEDLADLWNQLRTQVAELCREKRSAEYHCIECTLIWKRLREMNAVSPCADACGYTDNDSCRGRIPKFDGTNPAMEDPASAAPATGQR